MTTNAFVVDINHFGIIITVQLSNCKTTAFLISLLSLSVCSSRGQGTCPKSGTWTM